MLSHITHIKFYFENGLNIVMPDINAYKQYNTKENQGNTFYYVDFRYVFNNLIPLAKNSL